MWDAGCHAHCRLPPSVAVFSGEQSEPLLRQKVVCIVKVLFVLRSDFRDVLPGIVSSMALRLKISPGMKPSFLKGLFLEKTSLSGLGGGVYWLMTS